MTLPGYDPAAEVVAICSDLIAIDTSNYGDEPGPGERKAAEHVAQLLDEVGIEAEVLESEPGRTSLVARWAATRASRSSCTGTSTSYRLRPTTGRCTRSVARCATGSSGGGARST